MLQGIKGLSHTKEGQKHLTAIQKNWHGAQELLQHYASTVPAVTKTAKAAPPNFR